MRLFDFLFRKKEKVAVVDIPANAPTPRPIQTIVQPTYTPSPESVIPLANGRQAKTSGLENAAGGSPASPADLAKLHYALARREDEAFDEDSDKQPGPVRIIPLTGAVADYVKQHKGADYVLQLQLGREDYQSVVDVAPSNAATDLRLAAYQGYNADKWTIVSYSPKILDSAKASWKRTVKVRKRESILTSAKPESAPRPERP